MKRFFILLAALAFVSPAWAGSSWRGTLYSNTALSYSTAPVFDMNSVPLDSLSIHVLLSSDTLSTATFTDGVASTGSFTVSNYLGLIGAKGTDTLNVSGNTLIIPKAGTDTITVASNTWLNTHTEFFSLNGYVFNNQSAWSVGSSSAATAASIANAINASNTGFTATSSFGAVTVTCAQKGSFCNTYSVISSTPAGLTVGSSKFTGGQDNSSFTLNGRTYFQGSDWSQGVSSFTTAGNIALTTTTMSGITATVAGSTVTFSCSTNGVFCNTNTLSATTGMTVGAAKFAGGVNDGFFCIGGTCLSQGTDFTAATSSNTTAVNIKNAINANSTLNLIVAASTTVATGVVITTSTDVGATVNYGLFSSTTAALLASGATMTGGKASNVNTSNSSIAVASHGFGTGTSVLLSSTTGTTPGLLSPGTTYYAIVVDANNVQLATSQTNAVNGTKVSIATQTRTGGGSFKLVPLALSGSPGIQFQISNDCANWFNLPTTTTNGVVGISSVTFSSPYTAVNQIYDLGSSNFRCIRPNITGPTESSTVGGALNISVTGVGKMKIGR